MSGDSKSKAYFKMLEDRAKTYLYVFDLTTSPRYKPGQAVASLRALIEGTNNPADEFFGVSKWLRDHAGEDNFFRGINFVGITCPNVAFHFKLRWM